VAHQGYLAVDALDSTNQVLGSSATIPVATAQRT
jgi:hypothetical protein